jgi:hypothetical protein
MKAYTEARKKITPEQWAAERAAIAAKHGAPEKTSDAR